MEDCHGTDDGGHANKPSWVDLSSADAGSSREFYGKLFGWDVEVNPDPQYGGYALARIDGQDAAGIGPRWTPTRRRRGPCTSAPRTSRPSRSR